MAYVLSKQSRRACLLTLIAIVALISGDRIRSQGSSPCGIGINAIACENLQPGDPASSWDVSTAGDTTIQGFATDISVNHGQTIQFKVKTDAASYRLDIYRMGYYGGMGARKVATVTPSAALPQMQPACLTIPATGLIDCGNWAVSASWAVPASAVSGIYFARAVRNDSGGASHIFFIVRDDERHSDLLFQTSDATWQAYNDYGGNSLYVGSPAGRAYKVSYNRPFMTRAGGNGGNQTFVFSTEYPMVRWLEANGYDVSYTTGVDTDRRGAELLEHRVFLSVGHDEYWSGQQRTNVEAARDAGVNLAFFSGNEIFWKTRWENSIDASGTPYRTLVSYKETHANAKIDPTSAWTGTWRDPRFSPPADGGRPENSLTGTLFMVNGTRTDPMTVNAAEGTHRFWRNTSVASLPAGQTATFAAGVVGYEWDEAPNNSTRPAGLQKLSSTVIDVSPKYLLDYGSTYGNGTATHSLTLYRAASGALVFSAGTVQYSWLLDANHDQIGPAADPRLQQATVNLLADMGVQPGSLQGGLVGAAPSVDTTAPTSTITSPASGASVQSGTPVTISGTAADSGGGVVAAVEVSTDGGATWNLANGRSTWTYSWTPAGPGSATGSATLRTRATDDSGNLETPSAGVTVSITPLGGLVAAYGFNEGSGATAADASGGGNTGAIAGASWAVGLAGEALSFNGVDNWVTVNDANALDLTSAMTLEAWVKPTALSGWRSVVLKEATGNQVYSLYANDNVPRPATNVRIAGADRAATGTAGIPLNTWTHLAGTYDGTTERMYVNGVEVGNLPVTGSMSASTGALRIGGNAIWGEYFAGVIDEVRVYRRALSPGELQADMNTPVGGGPLPDTTAPTVSITAPVAGASVSGTTTVSASASDNVGVVGVQFLLDGSPLGAEDLTAPYSVQWTTTSVADGSHTLSARARDNAGNIGTATDVAVVVNNTPDSTPPTISITAPAAGATVSGITTVTASASDNVSVAGVTFFVDGTQIGVEDVAAPYSISWTTTSTTNGTHTLTARARDGAGNATTSAGVAVTVSNAAGPSGLVAAYGFDEGSGSTTTDASGKNNTGSITGATWNATGRYGKALTFNGTSNYVTVADNASLHLTTGMTLEAWVNPTALSGWRTAILKETTGSLTYSMYANNGSIVQPGGTINTGGTDQTAYGGTLPLNTWTHLAVTYDGANLRLYVNAVQMGTQPVTGSLISSTSPLRIGGNLIWGEYFSGSIDEVRVYNRALSVAELQSDMNTPVAGAPGDTTPPAVSVTAPAANANVVGTTTLTATATDAGGVAGVQFRVDGVDVGTEDVTAPFEQWWNSGNLPNGPHTITAVAWDNAGNAGTSTSVVVTVANPTDSASVGAWEAPFDWPVVAVHLALMHTGKVLTWQDEGQSTAHIYDPGTNLFTPIPLASGSDIYCAGQVSLADGRILVVGGDGTTQTGSPDSNIFDPVTQQWSSGAKMAFPRWYPTATTLGDGRVMAMSGGSTCFQCLVDLPEVYDPIANRWTTLQNASFAAPYYPFDFVLPDGRVLYAGASEHSFETRALDLNTGTWSVIDPIAVDGGSASMYAPGKIMKAGTAHEPTLQAVVPSAATTYVLDMNAATPRWRQTAPMAYARTYLNTTLLPDGSVLATGGGSNTDGITLSLGVLPAELWSPVTETWSTVASMSVPRLYHSTAVLLPDGRVLIAGGGAKNQVPGATDEANGQIYSPPYLFKGPRPTIGSAPSTISYGNSFFVATSDTIASVALMRPGAPTHAFNENQRFLNLAFETTTGGLTVHAPANSNLAPPGYYMLFILNSNGVPSVASFTRLPSAAEDNQAPSAPANLTASGSIGSVSLSWSASTDNTGVKNYNVHRGTTPGFTPTTANRIAQPTATSYVDNVSAGTYYYVVTAVDAAGNTSAPSNEASATATSDTTPPTVTITAPLAGATVSGSVAVSANASDNIAVAGVQFLLDGAALDVEDVTPPYSISWNTATATNGAHTLTARARDAAGNQTVSAAVSVTVSNTAVAGLVAAFGFNEGSGTATADGSGKGNNGLTTNTAWSTTGKYGGALSFNGTSSWVTVADAATLDLTNGMTIEAWVQPTAGGGWRTTIMKEAAGGLAYSLYANDNTPNPAVTVHIGAADRSAAGTSQVPLNTWTHLAATYDGSRLRLYVNGVQVANKAQTGNMTVSASPLRIGGNSVWGEYFAGLIDEVRVYNRALTATEIQTDMNTPVR